MNQRCIGLWVIAASLAACSGKPPPEEPERAVRTLVVDKSDAGGLRPYAAEVRARVEADLGFRVAGKLVRRSVQLGDTVQAGQLLAQLDPSDLTLGQQAAVAAVSAAQVNFDQAKADFDRFVDLQRQGFISAADLERRKSTLKAAKASLDQARAQASVEGNQAGYSQLRADAPGVITAVNAEVGMVVSAGMPVLRLAHAGPRDAVFSVPEDGFEAIRSLKDKPGAIKVRAWGQTGPLLPASVREIAAAADPSTRTFLVKADIGNAPWRLGQTATVLVPRPPMAGVARLPLSAVMQREGHGVVWVVDVGSMTVQPQPVDLAGADGNMLIVASGLKPGQRVVTAGVHLLTPAQKVRLYREPVTGSGTQKPSPASVADAAPQ